MKFSVLIAAYKAGRYISQALESVRAQTNEDWEVVVVEDGSHDETEAVVKKFAASVAQPVRYHNLGENRGVATARNRLMELAEGETLAFIDADDWWTPSHLARAQAAFDDGADIAIARIQLFDLDAGQRLDTYTPKPLLFTAPVDALYETSAVMSSSCVVLHREIVRRAGFFDPAFRIGEDRDYWLRCALAGAKFADTGEITCFYAKHAASTMARTLNWAQQEVVFYAKHHSLAILPGQKRRKFYAHSLSNYGRLLRAADPRASAGALWRAWKLTPADGRIFMQWLLSALHVIAHRSKPANSA